MPYTLRSAGPSPFGRKVTFAAAALGLSDQIRFEAADTMAEDDSIRRQNPLGKIPALILEDGRALYDSRVIVEYLDHVAGGGKLVPRDPDARFDALRLAALGDGILDAAILIVYESRFRPDAEPYAKWIDYQRGKISRSLAALEQEPPTYEPLSIGAIGLACALEYLDFRKQLDWRPLYPGLIAWLDGFNAVHPNFADSRPSA